MVISQNFVKLPEGVHSLETNFHGWQQRSPSVKTNVQLYEGFLKMGVPQ